jgi:acetylornithine deacetylase/succinyl-diaminopimelate desuccinylase-like protein
MTLQTELKSAIVSAVEARAPERDAFLARLVQTPSSNPPGDCTPIADVAAGLLEELGLEVERHPVPDHLVRRFGMISCTNLVVRQRFGEGPVIALNAHGDVVPPGEGWTHPPFGAEIADGFMYGRGVAVSKSDLATYTFALLALLPTRNSCKAPSSCISPSTRRSGVILGRSGCLSRKIVKPESLHFRRPRLFRRNRPTTAVCTLAVTVHGKSAHAAAPETGHDALEATTAILQALYAERSGYPDRVSEHPGIGHPNLTVGLISGGINTNVVPDKVTIRLDRRIIPEENPAEAESRLRQVIASAAAPFPGIEVQAERVLLASPLRQLPGAEALIEPICRHGREFLGEAPRIEGVPLYTDARLYAEAGIPTVSYGAGPRSFLEANGHRADERLKLSDLHAATCIVALTVAEVLRA